jgi:hypothetical protein
MAYTKNTWYDRNVEYPNRYTKTDIDGDTIELAPEPGTVTNAGTNITAARMNNIETGIDDAHSDISDLNNAVDDVNNSIFQTNLNLIKGLFTLEAQIAAGKQNLAQMAVDAFNDNTGIASGSSSNYTYDASNKYFKQTLLRDMTKIKTITPTGATCTTTYKVFGTAGVTFADASSKLSVSASSDYNLSTKNWTLRCRFNPITDVNCSYYLGRLEIDENNSFYIYLDYAVGGVASIGFLARNAGNYNANTTFSLGTLTYNTWCGIEVTRTGNTIMVFKDGTQAGSTYNLLNNTFCNFSAYAFTFGQKSGSGTFALDEIEFATNTARHTSNFTLETSEYAPDSYTSFLIHCNGTNGSTTFTDYPGNAPAMTLISNSLSASAAPTYMYISAKDSYDAGNSITYYVSRDNGTTWTVATKDTLIDVSSQPSGTALKIKAVTSVNSTVTDTIINCWAFGYRT